MQIRTLYTDGSAAGKNGGFGFAAYIDDAEVERGHGHLPSLESPEPLCAEVLAMAFGLDAIPPEAPVELCIDNEEAFLGIQGLRQVRHAMRCWFNLLQRIDGRPGRVSVLLIAGWRKKQSPGHRLAHQLSRIGAGLWTPRPAGRLLATSQIADPPSWKRWPD